MARLYTIKRFVDLDNKAVVFTCHDQEGKPTGERLRFDMSKVSPENIAYAALHGFNQRVGDAGALGYNKETNQFATPAEKFAAMQAVADHLMSGTAEWDLPRSANGPRLDSTIALLVKALMIEKPERDETAVSLKVKAMSIQVRKAMLRSERLASIVKELEAEQVKSVDTTALFDELDA